MRWREATSAVKGYRNGMLKGGRCKRAAEEIAVFVVPPPVVPFCEVGREALSNPVEMV